MGAFDKPTHAIMAMHIFVAEKGDYYEIADGLPQTLEFGVSNDRAWEVGLACGGTVKIFVEAIDTAQGV